MTYAQPAPSGKAAPSGKGTPPRAPQVQGQEPEEVPEEEELHSGMPAWLEAAFPWMVSVTFHLGIFLVAAFVIYVNSHQAQDDREQIVIPASFQDESTEVAHPGLNGDPNRDAAQDLIKDVDTHGWAQVKSDDNVASMLEGDKGDNAVDMIANGTGGSIGKGQGGNGKGTGGVLAAYGTPGGGNGIGVKFFDTRTAAKKIVYILDHSGSMLDTFDYLRQEAIRSVNGMLPVQSFNTVMVSEQASYIFPTLERMTPENKKDFAAKLNTYRAQGMNDDLLAPFQEAFEKAFAMQPEVIYFETDGHFDPRLMDVVTSLNKKMGMKVRVNCLAFVNHDPSYEDQLKEMAKKNGGAYKFISEKDLGK